MGDYRRMGYSASVTQALGDRVKVSVAAGRTDGLQLQDSPDALPVTGDNLRSGIRNTPRPWVTMEADASLPGTGTHLASSYGWTDPSVLMPIHVALTGRTDQQIGWNVYARQPLPTLGGMHMEMTVDLRNLLAQGYVGLRVRRAPRRADQRAARGAGRRQLHFLNGCCCVMQCSVPRPRTRSRHGNADHRAIGKQTFQRTQRGCVVLVAKGRHQD